MAANETGSSKGIAMIVGVVVLVIAALSIFGFYNGVRNEGIQQENTLEQQYQTNQNELSKITLTVKETIGIADKGNTQIDEIIKNAVQGRYDGAMDAGTGGAMFSAIQEAYPDLTANTALWAKVQDAIIAGRQSFANHQRVLSDRVSAYETWMEQGAVKSVMVDMIGFPSDNLEAWVGDDVYYGRAALERIKKPIVAKEATTAFETGEIAPLVEESPAK